MTKLADILLNRISAFLTLLISISLTITAWYFSQVYINIIAQERFDISVESVKSQIYSKMQIYEQILRGGVALFEVKNNLISREDWRTYISSLEIEKKFSGIQGIGFAKMIKKSEIERYQEQVRSEGYSDFTIRPLGDRDIYSTILYLEPMNERNKMAFGYDMFSEPVRREAMQRAMDSDLASLSGKVRLLQDLDSPYAKSGFLLYLPVYKKFKELDSIYVRRENILGFVYAPFRVSDFMNGINEISHLNLNFKIFDTDSIDNQNLMYENYKNSHYDSKYTKDIKIYFFGRTWRILFYSTPLFEKMSYSNEPTSIILAGFLINILLFLLIYLISKNHKELKYKNRELEYSESRFRKIYETASVSIWEEDWSEVISTIKNLQTIGIRDALSYISGNQKLTQELLSSIKILDVNPWTLKIFNATDKNRLIEHLNCELNTKIEFFLNELKALLSEKSVIIQETTLEKLNGGSIHILVSISLPSSSSNIAFVTMQDITEQQENQRQLRLISNMLRISTEAGNIGMWNWDLNSGVLSWDEHMHKLYETNLWNFKSEFDEFRKKIHPDDKDRVLKTLYRASRGECEYNLSFKILIAGKVKYIKAISMILRDESGKVERMVGINLDITEKILDKLALERAKYSAEMASIAKSQFLANMSHEIRTPLNGTIGLTQLTLETDLTDIQRDYLQKAQTSSKALLSIINDILDYSKIEAQKLTIENLPFRLKDIISNILDLFGFKAKEKGLLINFVIEPNIPSILIGDPLRLNQVLNNLVGNAIKFTDKGSVEIRIRELFKSQSECKLQFNIEDSGIGLTKEQQENIFEAFAQADSSFSRKYGGSGLGLIISKQLIKLMKGDIQVYSRFGIGSTFSFTASFKIGNLKQISEYEKSLVHIEDYESNLPDCSVLLVEDNYINQIVAKNNLENLGVRVDIANNGQEAIDFLKNSNFDIVFMDLQMPIMDGIEATKIIRTFNPKIPIIAMTAAVMQRDKELSLKAGMNAHISKPINKSELAHTLLKFVDKKIDFDENQKVNIVDRLYNVDGIDTPLLISRLNGNQKLMNRLLKNFVKEFENRAFGVGEENLKASLHNLKGVAINLAMVDLSEVISKVNIQNRDSLDELNLALQKSIEAIKNVIINESIEFVEVENREILEIISNISQDLKVGNFITLQRVEEFLSTIKTLVDDEVLSELSEYFNSYRYLEALNLLEKIKLKVKKEYKNERE